MDKRVDVSEAHEELMDKLFGSAMLIMVDVKDWKVSKKAYTEAMKEVQDNYGLKQGHPDFLEWVFTCVGRSPIIIDDEGADEDEPTSTN